MSITISRARTSGTPAAGDPAGAEKGGVFALNDEMKPHMYGDMEAFAQELRDMGYEDVQLIDTPRRLSVPAAGRP